MQLVIIQYFVFTILIIGCNAICDGIAKRIFELTNITSVFIPKFLNLSLSLNESRLSIFLETYMTSTRMAAELEILVPTPDSKSFNTFFKKYTEICPFLENPEGSDTLLYFLYHGIMNSNKQNKVFTKCPIEKVKFYYFGYKYILSIRIHFSFIVGCLSSYRLYSRY